MRKIELFFMFSVVFSPSLVSGAILVEGGEEFKTYVSQELEAMRVGKRGVVSKALLLRLDASSLDTIIRPLTADENTWHPNDPKGVRSNLVPLDTKIRGAERKIPTGAILYIHPNRVNPILSLYRLGNLVYELAMASDLNYGTYGADYKIREKRAVFFRNAWCDSLGFKLVDISDRVPTKEFQEAKAGGLIVEENSENFPILSALPPTH